MKGVGWGVVGWWWGEGGVGVCLCFGAKGVVGDCRRAGCLKYDFSSERSWRTLQICCKLHICEYRLGAGTLVLSCPCLCGRTHASTTTHVDSYFW